MYSYLLGEMELSFPVIVIHMLQEEVKLTLFSKHNVRKMYQERLKRNPLISNLDS
jgi:hypothetical protein